MVNEDWVALGQGICNGVTVTDTTAMSEALSGAAHQLQASLVQWRYQIVSDIVDGETAENDLYPVADGGLERVDLISDPSILDVQEDAPCEPTGKKARRQGQRLHRRIATRFVKDWCLCRPRAWANKELKMKRQ